MPHRSFAPDTSPFRRPRKLLVSVLTALLLASASTGSAQVATRVASDAPIVNFRLPTFTADGHREWLVRGSEARTTDGRAVDVRELSLTIFRGDASERIDTMILSPLARVLPDEQTVAGPGAIRVIDEEYEAGGADWSYDHRAKRISIRKDVRVAFRSELRNLLQ